MKHDAPPPQPDLDWAPSRARDLGDRVVALWQELLEKMPTLPVRQTKGETAVRDAVTFPVPDEPMPFDALLAHMRSIALEHSTLTGHPRFMAYISGAGTVPGAAAELIAAALNQNVGGWMLSPAATSIELHLTQWFAAELGLPKGAFGLLVSGGAMANFVALKAARDARMGLAVRKDGLRGRTLALYASTEAHAVVDRAADMLGLGTSAVRKIPVDDAYRMRMDLLEGEIAKDVAAGIEPGIVVGTAGTVATGAIDPLVEIAELCARHHLWFHVDGAYGALGALADDLKPLFAGLQRADSIAFDPHKWMYTPHSGGCVIAREPQRLADAFALRPTYVRQDKERTGAGIDFSMMGPQFSRGFQAFKIWISLLAHGKRAYTRRIAHDVALAKYMAKRAEAHPNLELMAPVTLSICCFRYVPDGLPAGSEAYLDALNERLMNEIQMDGRAFISNAVLKERFVLRACIVNFRTEARDIDATLDVAVELGARLHAEMRP